MPTGTVPRGATNTQANAPKRQQPPIPFVRAARRKSIQAFTQTVTLTTSVQPLAPIELPAAGFIRDLELTFTISSAGNTATVANPSGNHDFPWNYIASIQITNAAGDTIYVTQPGYFYYLIHKYSGVYQPPFNDPRNLPGFTAPTTGAGATAGSGSFFLNIPFELDPRDAFCALPNLAANKAYQVLVNLNPASVAYAGGGTAPNGTISITMTWILNYWSQPNPANGAQAPQMTAPEGVGSVSLWRLQTQSMTAGGDRITQLVNVGNVIRNVIFALYDNGTPSKRDDADWPALSYLRLNNDQLFLKPTLNWANQMKEYFGFGVAGNTKEGAGNLDAGVYVVGDFMAQHGGIEPDNPRDQYLVTLDSTLLQHEGANFGASAGVLYILTNEIKPIRASALYSINAV